MGKVGLKKVEKAALYMLAPNKEFLMECFVVKTASGKLIVIDGGLSGIGTKESPPYLPVALRAIAGLGENDYFEVDAWILSHAHGDHFYELAKMLNVYTQDLNYRVKNIYFDFPIVAKSYETEGIDKLIAGLENYANVNGICQSGDCYYDKINGLAVNANSVAKGLEITIDGVRIEFLQTYDLRDGENANDHSLVFRVWIDGRSILFLNDLGVNGGRRLLKTYGKKLKSDVCQMAHHGQDGAEKEVYQAIDAQMRLWTTPIWVWNNTKDYAIGDVRSWVNGGVDFTQERACDAVACLYPQYPENDYTDFAEWKRVIDCMQIHLPSALKE